MTTNLAGTFWEQNRLVVALVLTVGIIALAGAVYVFSAQRQRLTSFVGASRIIQALQLYRWVLGTAAVTVLVLSLFPRSSSGMGLLLYLFLWPLVIMQFCLACLPWQRLAQKGPGVAVVVAGAVGFFAFCIDRMLLQLAGYVG